MKKLDAILLSILIAVAAPVGTALMTLDGGVFDNPFPWLRALAIGVAVALGTAFYKWGQTHGPMITITPRSAVTPDYNTQFNTFPADAPSTTTVASTPLPPGWSSVSPPGPNPQS